MPHDNPMREGWNLDQGVLDSSGGLRVRNVDELTVGPGPEQTLYIICTPIMVRGASCKLNKFCSVPTCCGRFALTGQSEVPSEARTWWG